MKVEACGFSFELCPNVCLLFLYLIGEQELFKLSQESLCLGGQFHSGYVLCEMTAYDIMSR